MQKQNGFTLVELVVVIIILGILAVTAAPKFIGIQSDARVAALKGLKAGIEGANTNVYGKSAIAGEENNPKYNLPIPNQANPLGLAYGYLSADASSLKEAMNIDIGFMITESTSVNKDLKNEWIGFETKNDLSSAKSIKIWQHNAPQGCFLEYTESTGLAKSPTYTLPSVSDC